MAILISAPIRTGKTLISIELIFEYLNQGRQVYSNIVGLKVPGVIHINSNLQTPFDWRDLPNDSVLLYDEAHEHPAFSERDLLKNLTIPEYEADLKKLIKDNASKVKIADLEKEYAKALRLKKEQILDIGFTMSMHGHFGIEIILITQNPTKLSKDVLGNITLHYVMRRKFGFDGANIWTFGEAMTSWGKSIADQALEKRFWKYPKHLYNFYVSSEKHNVKKYFPKKYIAYALVPVFVFGLAYTKGSSTGFFGLGSKSTPAVEIKEGDLRTQQAILNPSSSTNSNLTQDLTGSSQTSIVEPTNPLPQYNINDPYNYSYLEKPKQTAYRVFSGCMTNNKGGYTAYDRQGTVIYDIDPSVCKRLIESGERPFNAFPMASTNPSERVSTSEQQSSDVKPSLSDYNAPI